KRPNAVFRSFILHCHRTKIGEIELQTTNEASDELILYFELPNGIFKNSIQPNLINNHEQP
ncbi:MAG TPA: hypothetical protein VFH08_00695, partial [Chitinophagaceae bacterium]|nr:hypothetical protein [Chitinophagaceae bacterium]